MANRITSNKRDREKSKQQKKLEKQKRKEMRKSQGTETFDDMIAYVDEHGVLHDTPPEPEKDDIKVEDIAVSTPKKTEEDEPEQLKGKVEFFNDSKGFGFIKETSGQKYFFHISNAPDEIKEGDNVAFDTEQDKRGINAVNISIVENK